MKRSHKAMVASARTVISCVRNHSYGRRYFSAMADYAEAGGLVAYRDNRPVYLCYGGRRTVDLMSALESYAETIDRK